MGNSAYERGLATGLEAKAQRDAGDYSWDLRWELADEAKTATGDSFVEFKRGLTDGLRGEA